MIQKLLDVVPGWVWAIAVAGAVANGLHNGSQRDAALLDAQTVKTTLATEREDRQRVAGEHAAAIAALGAQHATDQQTKEDSYAKQLADLEKARLTDAAVAGGLRNTIKAYAAASAQRPGEADATASQRARDQLSVVANLLGEGADLVVEGRGVIQRRDAEVGRLLQQIEIDRAACQAK